MIAFMITKIILKTRATIIKTRIIIIIQLITINVDGIIVSFICIGVGLMRCKWLDWDSCSQMQEKIIQLEVTSNDQETLITEYTNTARHRYFGYLNIVVWFNYHLLIAHGKNSLGEVLESEALCRECNRWTKRDSIPDGNLYTIRAGLCCGKTAD